MQLSPIGGFFEIELGQAASHHTLATSLSLPNNPHHTFVNARSALNLFVTSMIFGKVWLPAYLCPSLVQAAGHKIGYYGLNEELQPDVSLLNLQAQPGDMILAINYFGRAPGADFINFVQRRPDLIFVEDCAHTLDSGQAPWGDWRLFSPRKLIGVADGGYIIPCKSTVYSLPASLVEPSLEQWHAAILRFEDKEQSQQAIWHSLNQTKELNMNISMQQMSRLSRHLISSMAAEPIIRRRQENYQRVYQRLADFAFITGNVLDFCPLGFVMRLPPAQRDLVRERLIQENIFPALHWQAMPSPASVFKQEHQLAQELIMLPCDHRYNETHMDHVSALVLKVLKK